jgi:UDP-galactopyranose mutase
MKYDFVVVGSGFFGAVFAQQAKENGKSVLVIERRDHLGGNCYTYDWEDTNINVHQYGTHIFHVNCDKLWNYINRFATFNRYQHRVLTTYKDHVYAMPINLGTINQFYGVNLRPKEVEAFLESKKGNIPNPKNLEEKAISLIGEDLYEAFIKGYTTKQWGCDPKELSASIINRLPVRNDKYQGIPIGGYTPIIERLLEGIPVELGVDFYEDPEHWKSLGEKVVYTGPIDRYFEYEHGRLNWRSVRFQFELLDEEDYQGTSVMNYADMDVDWTRIHEPKHLHLEKTHTPNKTVIFKEWSQIDNSDPYYPVNFAEDKEKLAKYQELAAKEENIIFGGRLAEYKYYDMHQAIASALQKAEKELEG